jgi:hypothetical protein
MTPTATLPIPPAIMDNERAPMTIAVIGSGAMGSLIASRLVLPAGKSGSLTSAASMSKRSIATA